MIRFHGLSRLKRYLRAELYRAGRAPPRPEDQDLAQQQFREVFEGRLRALGRGHDAVVKHDCRGADLMEIVVQEFASLSSATKSRCDTQGPELLIYPEAAMRLASVLHELATNAMKYGALSAGEGHVDVRWHVREDSPSRVLILEWTESGGPPVAPPRQHGFGLSLVECHIVGDLNGDVDFRFDPEGFRCTLQFPLDAPLNDERDLD